MTLTNCIVKGNTTHNNGGGIYNAGTLTISNSTFSHNTALGGGAIENAGGGTLAASNSTFIGNTANSASGAIASTGTLTLTNSTLSGNSAPSGGAVWTGYQTATLLNDTIVLNTANAGNGGGLLAYSGTVNLANSIIDGNTGGDESGSLAVNTNNLISSALPLNKIINTTLAQNGAAAGAPLTYALVAGGPAVDAGTTTLAQVFGNLPTTDERGMPRISGVTVDIGADELQKVYTVSSTADDSSGKTLRDLVNLVNGRDGGTIVFDPNVFTGVQTITLTQGQLNLNSNITIVGPNQGVIISGNNASRVVNIPSGAIVNLSHLTITKGQANTGSGGGINNYGTLTLSNSTISGNTAINDGGGIFNGGSLTLSNSTISNNNAINAGGIFNVGTLTLSNSTISGNTTSNAGGGIMNDGGGTATLLNDTIVLNQAQMVGGIYNYVGTMNVANTLIAGNKDNNNNNVVGSLASNINNLISPSISGIINPTLALNGAPAGSPLTYALLTGSPAINSGDNNPGAPFGSLPATDERGKPRIDGGTVDIGAFEF